MRVSAINNNIEQWVVVEDQQISTCKVSDIGTDKEGAAFVVDSQLTIVGMSRLMLGTEQLQSSTSQCNG